MMNDMFIFNYYIAELAAAWINKAYHRLGKSKTRELCSRGDKVIRRIHRTRITPCLSMSIWLIDNFVFQVPYIRVLHAASASKLNWRNASCFCTNDFARYNRDMEAGRARRHVYIYMVDSLNLQPWRIILLFADKSIDGNKNVLFPRIYRLLCNIHCIFMGRNSSAVYKIIFSRWINQSVSHNDGDEY